MCEWLSWLAARSISSESIEHLILVGAALVAAPLPIRRAEIVAQRAATRAAPTQNPFPSIQFLARNPRPVGKRLQLRPHDAGMDFLRTCERRKAAVRAGDHVLAADHLGKP